VCPNVRCHIAQEKYMPSEFISICSVVDCLLNAIGMAGDDLGSFPVVLTFQNKGNENIGYTKEKIN
jgi:hypothetical protein